MRGITLETSSSPHPLLKRNHCSQESSNNDQALCVNRVLCRVFFDHGLPLCQTLAIYHPKEFFDQGFYNVSVRTYSTFPLILKPPESVCSYKIDTSLSADDMHIEAASQRFDHESGEAADESTAYHIIANGALPLSCGVSSSEDEDERCPINEIESEVTTNSIGVVPLSSDARSSEDEDESSGQPISGIRSEVTANPVGVVPLSGDGTLSGNENGTLACLFSETKPEATKSPLSSVSALSSRDSDTLLNESDQETATESDEESATDSVDEMSGERILREQTLRTWLKLVDVAEDEEMDDFTQSMAATVADIVEWWRQHTKDTNPSTYHIDFGVGSPINLLMILALLPERLQSLISIEDERRSPSSNGENMSWLHEQTVDVLIRLSIDPNPGSLRFGQGLASMVRDSVDSAWRVFTERSWLEDQLHLQSQSELECDQYRFPPSTTKIVFLFNPTEIHWTVVEISLADQVWTYTLYNSLSQAPTGATWKASQEQLPLLEQLICRASGFAPPATREIVVAKSAQQENAYDCGPITVYNAIELLEGREPCTEVDSEELRLNYLELIRDALYVLDEGLGTEAFRAYMRQVYLDYLP